MAGKGELDGAAGDLPCLQDISVAWCPICFTGLKGHFGLFGQVFCCLSANKARKTEGDGGCPMILHRVSYVPLDALWKTLAFVSRDSSFSWGRGIVMVVWQGVDFS